MEKKRFGEEEIQRRRDSEKKIDFRKENVNEKRTLDKWLDGIFRHDGSF